MNMNLRSTFILTAVAIVAIATPITFMARANHDDTTFRARLTGCGGGGRPACPDGPDHSGEVTGTWTAADILAVPAQNVSAGDFAGILRILRAHEGYANIHTTLFPGGEIRGQAR